MHETLDVVSRDCLHGQPAELRDDVACDPATVGNQHCAALPNIIAAMLIAISPFECSDIKNPAGKILQVIY